jgi:predicted small metal-binding protein
MMAKKFMCADICMNCGFEARASTVEQLMPRIADHAKTAHGMTEIPKDTLAKDQAAIKEA